jgi:heme/copper-type cytochrome/quinol oxidase subunit 4
LISPKRSKQKDSKFATEKRMKREVNTFKLSAFFFFVCLQIRSSSIVAADKQLLVVVVVATSAAVVTVSFLKVRARPESFVKVAVVVLCPEVIWIIVVVVVPSSVWAS